MERLPGEDTLRKSSSFALAALLTLAGSAWARTPDGQPPSVETVCDAEVGAAFGLCNAYCEAMDCDSPNHRASDRACQVVGENFTERTGRPLPCQVTCPCVGQLPIFTDVIEGTEPVASCIIVDQVIFVADEAENELARIFTGPPGRCTDFSGAGVDLTPTEVQICRVALRAASEVLNGVPCTTPE